MSYVQDGIVTDLIQDNKFLSKLMRLSQDDIVVWDNDNCPCAISENANGKLKITRLLDRPLIRKITCHREGIAFLDVEGRLYFKVAYHNNVFQLLVDFPVIRYFKTSIIQRDCFTSTNFYVNIQSHVFLIQDSDGLIWSFSVSFCPFPFFMTRTKQRPINPQISLNLDLAVNLGTADGGSLLPSRGRKLYLMTWNIDDLNFQDLDLEIDIRRMSVNLSDVMITDVDGNVHVIFNFGRYRQSCELSVNYRSSRLIGKRVLESTKFITFQLKGRQIINRIYILQDIKVRDAQFYYSELIFIDNHGLCRGENYVRKRVEDFLCRWGKQFILIRNQDGILFYQKSNTKGRYVAKKIGRGYYNFSYRINSAVKNARLF